jgi:hypothetical protein
MIRKKGKEEDFKRVKWKLSRVRKILPAEGEEIER